MLQDHIYFPMIRGRTSSSEPRTPIWLDCDTGHDDAFAILLAARSPNVKLLGISTVYGNAPLESTTYNTRAILKAIGREDVPVYAGASRPLRRDAAHAADIHGESGLDGTYCLPQPTVLAHEQGALDAINAVLTAQPAGTAWLVATGTLTNMAMLFERHPALTSHIAGLSIMGGAIGGDFTDAPTGAVLGEGERFGNWTPNAEFNIYCDPEAGHAIFSQAKLAAKTVLIPLDVTHQFLATSTVRMGLLFGAAQSISPERTIADVSPHRRLFFEIATFFAKTYADIFGFKLGPPVHDPLAVVAAFRPDLFVYNDSKDPSASQAERFHVQVVTEGERGNTSEIRSEPSQCGRTVVTPAAPGQPGVTIPRGLDSQSIWVLIEGCLSRTDHALGSSETPSTAAHRKTQDPLDGQADFASLVGNSGETTLSQVEVMAGIPDIRVTAKNPENLKTNKISSLNIQPMEMANPEAKRPAVSLPQHAATPLQVVPGQQEAHERNGDSWQLQNVVSGSTSPWPLDLELKPVSTSMTAGRELDLSGYAQQLTEMMLASQTSLGEARRMEERRGRQDVFDMSAKA
ncbi:Uridine nucleosidase 1 [Recurvomyces mirabilis]|uniref:Uridine nucleosidase 1 n=1 Tax=Recurvomyces mirabilis TaxID=574656 RepID=A0AAE1C1P4_9PEZI|nr:Uridine nucleosidase 1 [Recurvomyces mirabilis]